MRVLVGIITLYLILTIKADLILDDEVLGDLFWCPKTRCCLPLDDAIWEAHGYTHTNECETDQECYYNAVELHGCGSATDNLDYFVTRTRHVCLPMGSLGKKYCTLGCKLYSPVLCSDHDSTYDSINGEMHYCYLYSDSITGDMYPDCPCFRQNCNGFVHCLTNPIEALPIPPPSPLPSPSPSPV